jgi:hypothetical protein
MSRLKRGKAGVRVRKAEAMIAQGSTIDAAIKAANVSYPTFRKYRTRVGNTELATNSTVDYAFLERVLACDLVIQEKLAIVRAHLE